MGQQDDIRALLDQGLTCYGLGKVGEALQAWNRVLELDPGNPKAKEYLTFVQQNWGPSPPEGPAKPYRPDEGSDGSGQIQTPLIPQAVPPNAASGDQHSPEKEGSGDGYQAPVKPPIEGAVWGDLYDFGTTGKGWDSPPPVPEPDVKAPNEPDPAAFPLPASPPAADPPPPEEPQVSTNFDAWERLLQADPSDNQPGREPVSPLQPEPVPPQAGAEPAPADWGVPGQDDTWSAFASGPPPLQPESPAPGNGQSPGGQAPADSQPGGDALDLVAGAPPEMPRTEPEPASPASPDTAEIDTWLQGARDLLELDDFSGALELLAKVLGQDPDRAEARQMRDQAESQLLGMLSSKLGELDQVPRVQMPEDEIIWLNYDHRAGFVLSLVDGELTYDEIISVSGLSQLECMRLLVQFLLEKVIAVD